MMMADTIFGIPVVVSERRRDDVEFVLATNDQAVALLKDGAFRTATLRDFMRLTPSLDLLPDSADSRSTLGLRNTADKALAGRCSGVWKGQ
jgi:hypothetical protein